jgi:hypothetical protein
MHGLLESIKTVVLSEGGESSERQEYGIIDAINKSSKGKPITVNGIKDVLKAEKMTGTNKLGTEPYTDVILTLKDGSKYNLSLKGGTESGLAIAPSVAGGGMEGLQTLIPDIVSTFLNKANQWYISNKFKKGDQIPDVYGKLHPSKTALILKGTKDMGGPVDAFYIGPMDVKIKSFENGILQLNGTIQTIQDYVKTHSIYFRIRKRREDQSFEPNLKDKNGNPAILGKSPSKGDTGRRIVMTSSIPANANLIEL